MNQICVFTQQRCTVHPVSIESQKFFVSFAYLERLSAVKFVFWSKMFEYLRSIVSYPSREPVDFLTVRLCFLSH